MMWAERMQTGAAGVDALIHFSTFDWRLCGEQIGHPLSSTWEAVVDLRWGEGAYRAFCKRYTFTVYH